MAFRSHHENILPGQRLQLGDKMAGELAIAVAGQDEAADMWAGLPQRIVVGSTGDRQGVVLRIWQRR